MTGMEPLIKRLSGFNLKEFDCGKKNIFVAQ